MSRATNSYEETIQRMRKSINRLDNEIERSKQITQDITIKNKTSQNINLIIKVEDQYDNFESSINQSRVTLPQRSSYHHRISSSRQRQNQKNQTNRYRTIYPLRSNDQRQFETQQNQDKYSIYKSKISQFDERENYSSVKIQRKFQPFAHLEANKSTLLSDRKIISEVNKRGCIQSAVQTEQKKIQKNQSKSQQSQVSQVIDQEAPINMVPILPNQQKRVHDKLNQYKETKSEEEEIIENLQPVPLPQSTFSFSDKKNKNQQTLHSLINESPLVMNYLKQKVTDEHSGINTPNNKLKQESNTNSNSKLQPSNKFPQRNNTQWKVQPLSISYQNNKKYFEIANQKSLFKKCKAEERKNKFNNPSPDSRLKNNIKNSQNKNINTSRSKSKQESYLSRFQVKQTNSDNKIKANDLFLERKALFLKKLDIARKNQIQTQRNKASKSRSKTQQGSFVLNPTTIKRESKFIQMSPKAKQVSERLYSRSKQKLKPCDYYQRHSQSIERERFYDIVRQNSFVGKYVSREQQQSLFQSFRRLDDSVSTWPMKIVNYTYSKLQKINVSRYSIKKTLA